VDARSLVADASVDFDPWSNALNRFNIWTIYRQMREQAPAVHSTARGGFWVITRYADVRRAAFDYKTFISGNGSRIGFRGTLDPPAAAIEYDPPDHRRFRSVMIAPFTAGRIGELSDVVDRHVQLVVDAAIDAGSFDVVHDLGEPLAVGVISEILGFDDEARARNRHLTLAVVGASHHDASNANAAYEAFLYEEIQKRVETPSDGFLGQLVTRSMEDDAFTSSELMSIARAMALAGHHTTINGVASMLLRVADDEVRKRWISKSPVAATLVSGFVEESLRIDPPIHMEARWTTDGAEIDGVQIPAESQVALVYASANHDEAMFARPEEFDPTRAAGHLAFGHGIHTCLGMALARMEMSTLLAAVLERMPALRLTDEPVDSGMFFGHHMGWHSMPAAIG
jgi:cytochrome P450